MAKLTINYLSFLVERKIMTHSYSSIGEMKLLAECLFFSIKM